MRVEGYRDGRRVWVVEGGVKNAVREALARIGEQLVDELRVLVLLKPSS